MILSMYKSNNLVSMNDLLQKGFQNFVFFAAYAGFQSDVNAGTTGKNRIKASDNGILGLNCWISIPR